MNNLTNIFTKATGITPIWETKDEATNTTNHILNPNSVYAIKHLDKHDISNLTGYQVVDLHRLELGLPTFGDVSQLEPFIARNCSLKKNSLTKINRSTTVNDESENAVPSASVAIATDQHTVIAKKFGATTNNKKKTETVNVDKQKKSSKRAFITEKCRSLFKSKTSVTDKVTENKKNALKMISSSNVTNCLSKFKPVADNSCISAIEPTDSGITKLDVLAEYAIGKMQQPVQSKDDKQAINFLCRLPLASSDKPKKLRFDVTQVKEFNKEKSIGSGTPGSRTSKSSVSMSKRKSILKSEPTVFKHEDICNQDGDRLQIYKLLTLCNLDPIEHKDLETTELLALLNFAFRKTLGTNHIFNEVWSKVESNDMLQLLNNCRLSSDGTLLRSNLNTIPDQITNKIMTLRSTHNKNGVRLIKNKDIQITNLTREIFEQNRIIESLVKNPNGLPAQLQNKKQSKSNFEQLGTVQSHSDTVEKCKQLENQLRAAKIMLENKNDQLAAKDEHIDAIEKKLQKAEKLLNESTQEVTIVNQRLNDVNMSMINQKNQLNVAESKVKSLMRDNSDLNNENQKIIQGNQKYLAKLSAMMEKNRLLEKKIEVLEVDKDQKPVIDLKSYKTDENELPAIEEIAENQLCHTYMYDTIRRCSKPEVSKTAKYLHDNTAKLKGNTELLLRDFRSTSSKLEKFKRSLNKNHQIIPCVRAP